MSRNITLILGHPDPGSFCGALADAYAEAARSAGHTVKVFKLGELQFDPILHEGYKTIQPLEPDLLRLQEAITWADHLVLVYPIWWGSMPALLKGLFDRVLLPGFAFKYRKDSPLWDKLLKGRSAHVFLTLDTPGWYNWLVNRRPGHRQIRKTILQFCGIDPVRITPLAPVRHSTPEQRQRWLAQVAQAARRAR